MPPWLCEWSTFRVSGIRGLPVGPPVVVQRRSRLPGHPAVELFMVEGVTGWGGVKNARGKSAGVARWIICTGLVAVGFALSR